MPDASDAPAELSAPDNERDDHDAVAGADGDPGADEDAAEAEDGASAQESADDDGSVPDAPRAEGSASDQPSAEDPAAADADEDGALGSDPSEGATADADEGSAGGLDAPEPSAICIENAPEADALTEHLVPITAPTPTCPLPAQLAGKAQDAPITVYLSRPTAADARHDRRLAQVLVVVALGIALAFAGVSAFFAAEGQREAAVTLLPAKVPVTVPVSAPGLDSATGTRIPVHVVGVDKDGNQVDQVAYVTSAGEGLTLVPGTYELSIAGSPLAEDGTVYAVPERVVGVDVPAVKQARLEGDPFELEPLDPADVTAEAVDDAYAYAVRGGCPLERAPELKVAAQERAGL